MYMKSSLPIRPTLHPFTKVLAPDFDLFFEKYVSKQTCRESRSVSFPTKEGILKPNPLASCFDIRIREQCWKIVESITFGGKQRLYFIVFITMNDSFVRNSSNLSFSSIPVSL